MQCKAIFEALSELKKNKKKISLTWNNDTPCFYGGRNKDYEGFGN
jgi:hypothetical protein